MPASAARTVGLCAIVFGGLLVIMGTYLLVDEAHRDTKGGVLALVFAILLLVVGVAADRKRYDDDPPKKDAQKKVGEVTEEGKQKD
ncbi:MAG: hypothetical protein L6R28_23525 [Planctomycetes bacterium]|nr:hypothetical protein [Planctomycetota bacterium]